MGLLFRAAVSAQVRPLISVVLPSGIKLEILDPSRAVVLLNSPEFSSGSAHAPSVPVGLHELLRYCDHDAEKAPVSY